MNALSIKHPLEESLIQLESQLETPVIAGDLVNWLESAMRLWQSVGQPLTEQIEQVHPESFKRIRHDDDGLLRRIELMQAEDVKLTELYACQLRTIKELHELAVESEPNEAKVEGHVSNATAEGLQFIIEVRKQEHALATWLQEAELRMNGGQG